MYINTYSYRGDRIKGEHKLRDGWDHNIMFGDISYGLRRRTQKSSVCHPGF